MGISPLGAHGAGALGAPFSPSSSKLRQRTEGDISLSSHLAFGPPASSSHQSPRAEVDDPIPRVLLTPTTLVSRSDAPAPASASASASVGGTSPTSRHTLSPALVIDTLTAQRTTSRSSPRARSRPPSPCTPSASPRTRTPHGSSPGTIPAPTSTSTSTSTSTFGSTSILRSPAGLVLALVSLVALIAASPVPLALGLGVGQGEGAVASAALRVREMDTGTARGVGQSPMMNLPRTSPRGNGLGKGDGAGLVDVRPRGLRRLLLERERGQEWEGGGGGDEDVETSHDEERRTIIQDYPPLNAASLLSPTHPDGSPGAGASPDPARPLDKQSDDTDTADVSSARKPERPTSYHSDSAPASGAAPGPNQNQSQSQGKSRRIPQQRSKKPTSKSKSRARHVFDDSAAAAVRTEMDAVRRKYADAMRWLAGAPLARVDVRVDPGDAGDAGSGLGSGLGSMPGHDETSQGGDAGAGAEEDEESDTGGAGGAGTGREWGSEVEVVPRPGGPVAAPGPGVDWGYLGVRPGNSGAPGGEGTGAGDKVDEVVDGGDEDEDDDEDEDEDDKAESLRLATDATPGDNDPAQPNGQDPAQTPLQSDKRKRGSSGPSLIRRGAYDSPAVPLRAWVQGSMDVLYYGDVRIGEPEQLMTVDFDTGSADLWGPVNCSSCAHNYRPQTSHRSSFTGEAFEVQYGSGHVKGKLVQDVVKLGSWTVPNQFLGAVDEMSADFDDNPNDGVMGMAFSSISTSGKKTFFENLVDQGSIRAPIFSFHLTRRQHEGSQLCVGCYDSSKYHGGFTWVPIISKTYWSVSMTGFSADGRGANALSRTLVGAIDTGTTLIYVPPRIASTFYGQIAGAREAPQFGQGFWQYPCAADKDLQLVLGFNSRGFKWDTTDFNLGRTGRGSSMCVGAILAVADGFPEDLAIIGDVFLKSWYSIFDQSSDALIGLAASVNNV